MNNPAYPLFAHVDLFFFGWHAGSDGQGGVQMIMMTDTKHDSNLAGDATKSADEERKEKSGPAEMC